MTRYVHKQNEMTNCLFYWGAPVYLWVVMMGKRCHLEIKWIRFYLVNVPYLLAVYCNYDEQCHPSTHYNHFSTSAPTKQPPADMWASNLFVPWCNVCVYCVSQHVIILEVRFQCLYKIDIHFEPYTISMFQCDQWSVSVDNSALLNTLLQLLEVEASLWWITEVYQGK